MPTTRSVCFTHQQTRALKVNGKVCASNAVLLSRLDNDPMGNVDLGIGCTNGTLSLYKVPHQVEPFFQAHNLGCMTAMVTGNIFLGSRSLQLMVFSSEGRAHIFDIKWDERSFSSYEEYTGRVRPVFSMPCPLNITSAVINKKRPEDGGRPEVIVGTADGSIMVLELVFKQVEYDEDESDGRSEASLASMTSMASIALSIERESSSKEKTLPELNTVAEFRPAGAARVVSVAIVSAHTNRDASNGLESQSFKRKSAPFLVAGLNYGLIEVLKLGVDEASSAISPVPVPMATGGGIPLSAWGWSGETHVTTVTDPSEAQLQALKERNGEAGQKGSSADSNVEGLFGICTLDGRIGVCQVTAGNAAGEAEDHTQQDSWCTLWSHQTQECLFVINMLPFNDTEHLLVACSWSGKVFMFGIAGDLSMAFDPGDFLAHPIQAFRAGMLRITDTNEPVLVFVPDEGEVLVYHDLFKQVGALHQPSFLESADSLGVFDKLEEVISGYVDLKQARQRRKVASDSNAEAVAVSVSSGASKSIADFSDPSGDMAPPIAGANELKGERVEVDKEIGDMSQRQEAMLIKLLGKPLSLEDAETLVKEIRAWKRRPVPSNRLGKEYPRLRQTLAALTQHLNPVNC
ncbi:unnamed protein product [Chrysoparadoxa australica]